MDDRDREITRAGAQIEHTRTRRERQRIDRPIAPPAIHACAEYVIEKIVTRRNRIEHVRDARGVFVGYYPFHAG
jgi:hypothetical protein